jgi:hypothetical protein
MLVITNIYGIIYSMKDSRVNVLEKGALLKSWIEWPSEIDREKLLGLMEKVRSADTKNSTMLKAAEYGCAAAETWLALSYGIDNERALELATEAATSDTFKDELIDLMATNPGITPTQVAEHFAVSHSLRHLLSELV